MTGPTMEELRELSRRSRNAQGWGFLAMLGTLGCFPALGLVWAFSPGWFIAAAYAAAAAAGVLFVQFAYHQGKARGAFRRVFKRLRDERKAARQAVAPEPDVMTA